MYITSTPSPAPPLSPSLFLLLLLSLTLSQCNAALHYYVCTCMYIVSSLVPRLPDLFNTCEKEGEPGI